MNYHFPCKADAGFNRVFTVGEAEMKLTGFGLLKLAAGEVHAAKTGALEVALVILGGRCAVRGANFNFPDVGGRADVFSGLPHTVYLPRETDYEITAAMDVEIAVAESPATRSTCAAALIGPDKVKSMSIGRDNFTRQALIMLDEKFPAQHFFIGEALVPSGHWASFPPHRHDFDNPPEEIDMEEIYFFRFQPKGGFGIQKIYTDSRDIDVACTVRENDTVAIPRGYHPVVNAPGYTMYYLWVMTGDTRGFINFKDPAHSWIK
ncbi:MAG: 5-deoxy-glucuronate isomerase [Opitutaceae bacterium]|jgi:5-deoxy-glucuronate isomerase|nr:5-deoxy-glucuronate isomerase [Opitutaceae bacterium]